MAKRNRAFTIKLLAVIAIAGMAMAAGSVCAKPGRDVPVIISGKQLSMKAGGTSQIKISGSNILEVKYSSSDKQVAAVSKKGKITAKHTGDCKININVLYRAGKDGRRKKKLVVNVNVKNKEDGKLQSFKVSINKKEFNAKVYNTDAAKEFYRQLPMKIKMSELNGNEKFYYMDKTFPEDRETPGTINAGDIMLYGDNCLVLFYETFQSSYAYTKIGYIEDPSGLAEELGKGGVEVSFSK